jgi:transposase-like protein
LKGSRYSEEQIVRILRAAESGTVAVAARDHGVTEHTIYRWRKKYAGMEVSDVRDLKRLREENQRLKRMLADRDLELEVMREIQEKKW